MSELCTDNRFELIEKYKQNLIEASNIETAQDEMAVIDNILFRFWQMGWLDKLDADAVPVVRCKDCKVKDEERCPWWHGVPEDEFYCAWGERKDNETD